MNGPVQPPCTKPPSGSSPACPGACTTPSRDTYSMTASFLIESPPHRFPIRNEHRPGARSSARQNDRQITGSFRSRRRLAGSRLAGSSVRWPTSPRPRTGRVGLRGPNQARPVGWVSQHRQGDGMRSTRPRNPSWIGNRARRRPLTHVQILGRTLSASPVVRRRVSPAKSIMSDSAPPLALLAGIGRVGRDV